MLYRLVIALTAFSSTVGSSAYFADEPTDSFPGSQLDELTVTTVASKKMFGWNPDGSISLTASMLHELPSFMGGDDPLALLRTLPSVATSNELQPGITVRGSASGSNLFESDGVRIFNPLHLLGLFSTYNPTYYKDFHFRPIFIPATFHNSTGGFFSAVSSPASPDSIVTGKVSVGLLESHASIALPLLKNKVSLRLGARMTYLDLLFPSLLKMGSSSIKYAFSDFNAGVSVFPSEKDVVNFSFFSSSDDLDLENSKNGDKEGYCGWNNIAAGLEWIRNGSRLSLNHSRFDNSFKLLEGGKSIHLPSDFSQTTLGFSKPLGKWILETDVALRHSSGRHTTINSPDNTYPDDKYAVEYNLAARWNASIFNRLVIDAGLRTSFYTSGNYSKVRPQPRLSLSFNFTENFNLFCSYGIYYRFDKLVEVTSGGLPADFRINASHCAPEEHTEALSMGVAGYAPFLHCQFSVEGYGKKIRHAGEFSGSVIDFVNPDYNPLANLLDGNGYSFGLSLSLMRQFGRFRFRTAYNIGKSRLKFKELGNSYFPSSHDRLHDLSSSVSFTVADGLNVSASFTHATGLPYTKAKYGYMIEENLICEYFPHNSSRLPAYNRLDFSANWVFLKKGKCTHSLNASIYNALASNNILFIYTSYSVEHGIRQKKSAMDMVIPSLTYSLSF